MLLSIIETPAAANVLAPTYAQAQLCNGTTTLPAAVCALISSMTQLAIPYNTGICKLAAVNATQNAALQAQLKIPTAVNVSHKSCALKILSVYKIKYGVQQHALAFQLALIPPPVRSIMFGTHSIASASVAVQFHVQALKYGTPLLVRAKYVSKLFYV